MSRQRDKGLLDYDQDKSNDRNIQNILMCEINAKVTIFYCSTERLKITI
jgi:hypothetical protein